MRVSLHTADLRYDGQLVVHTASSGAVPTLSALYLRLDDGHVIGVGEVRTNIAYLNGLASETVVAVARETVGAVDWSQNPVDLLAALPEWAGGCPAPVRMLIDCALHDLIARRAGVSVASVLGSNGPCVLRTNQTLFWSPLDTFRDQAIAYVERGFRDLKVRIAVTDMRDDIRRLELLRNLFGDQVTIAVDANGGWNEDDAIEHLNTLAKFDLAYVEQPVPSGNMRAIARLAQASPVPVMLDESVSSAGDVERICHLGGLVWAHLKLVKLGGIGPTLTAARKLSEANVPFMIGQMNEGGCATAAALHLAVATSPAFIELYGADGLNNDPVSGLKYRDGFVQAEDGPGLGISFDVSKTQLLQEH